MIQYWVFPVVQYVGVPSDVGYSYGEQSLGSWVIQSLNLSSMKLFSPRPRGGAGDVVGIIVHVESRGEVCVDGPVLGMSGGCAVERAAGKTFVRISGCSTQIRTSPQRHCKRGYGDGGVCCRPSIENVQLVVRSNRGAIKAGRE